MTKLAQSDLRGRFGFQAYKRGGCFSLCLSVFSLPPLIPLSRERAHPRMKPVLLRVARHRDRKDLRPTWSLPSLAFLLCEIMCFPLPKPV